MARTPIHKHICPIYKRVFHICSMQMQTQRETNQLVKTYYLLMCKQSLSKQGLRYRSKNWTVSLHQIAYDPYPRFTCFFGLYKSGGLKTRRWEKDKQRVRRKRKEERGNGPSMLLYACVCHLHRNDNLLASQGKQPRLQMYYGNRREGMATQRAKGPDILLR